MKYMKCFRWYEGTAGNFFPNNIYLSNYHFTHREKPIIQSYDCWVVLCTVKNLNKQSTYKYKLNSIVYKFNDDSLIVDKFLGRRFEKPISSPSIFI
jgi:hypothetical protein